MNANMLYANNLDDNSYVQQIQSIVIPSKDLLLEHMLLTHPQTIRYIRSAMSTNIQLPLAVEEALVLMENNLQEPLGICELADLIGLSRRHLERQFAACLGTSPSKVYMEIRLRYAYTLINSTKFKICHISQLCGFASSTSFSCLFKQKFALPPSKIRTQQFPELAPAV